MIVKWYYDSNTVKEHDGTVVEFRKDDLIYSQAENSAFASVRIIRFSNRTNSYKVFVDGTDIHCVPEEKNVHPTLITELINEFVNGLNYVK